MVARGQLIVNFLFSLYFISVAKRRRFNLGIASPKYATLYRDEDIYRGTEAQISNSTCCCTGTGKRRVWQSTPLEFAHGVRPAAVRVNVHYSKWARFSVDVNFSRGNPENGESSLCRHFKMKNTNDVIINVGSSPTYLNWMYDENESQRLGKFGFWVESCKDKGTPCKEKSDRPVTSGIHCTPGWHDDIFVSEIIVKDSNLVAGLKVGGMVVCGVAGAVGAGFAVATGVPVVGLAGLGVGAGVYATGILGGYAKAGLHISERDRAKRHNLDASRRFEEKAPSRSSASISESQEHAS